MPIRHAKQLLFQDLREEAIHASDRMDQSSAKEEGDPSYDSQDGGQAVQEVFSAWSDRWF